MTKSDGLQTPAAILHENVEALLAHHCGRKPNGEVTWHHLVSRFNLANGTAQRIKESRTSIGIDLVADVARAFGLQTWQLLVPNLDPHNPPVVTMSEAERRLYVKLRDAAKAWIDQNP